MSDEDPAKSAVFAGDEAGSRAELVSPPVYQIGPDAVKMCEDPKGTVDAKLAELPNAPCEGGGATEGTRYADGRKAFDGVETGVATGVAVFTGERVTVCCGERVGEGGGVRETVAVGEAVIVGH